MLLTRFMLFSKGLLPGLRRRYLVRQYDRTDCGPAALLTLLRRWGGDAPLAQVRELAGTDVSGTTFLGMVRAARRLGFEARGVAGSYPALLEEQDPCIAHLVLEDGTQHYVVVESVRPDRVRVADPMDGHRWMPRAEFEERWRSRALLLLTPTPELASHRYQGWVGWFVNYLRREPVWFIQSLFLGGIGALFGVVTALFIRALVDRLIPEGNERMILSAGAVIGGILLIRIGTGHLRDRFMIRLHRKVSLDLHRDFLGHLLRLPQRFFESRTTGDVSSRLADGMRIQRAFVDAAATALIDGVLLCASLAFLLISARPLGILALLAAPVYAAAAFRGAAVLRREHGRTMAAYAKVEGTFLDSLGSVDAISGHGVAPAFLELNAARFRHFQDRMDTLGIQQARLALLTESFGGILSVLALALGGLLVVREEFLLGEFIAGYSLLMGILPSVGRILQSVVSFQEATIAATRLRDLLLTPTEPWEAGAPLEAIHDLRLVAGKVEWADGTRPFEEATLRLRRGEMVGIVGSNGSGKSTLARILTRAIHLESGNLLVDGRQAEEFSLADYRRRVLLLPNGVRLIGGTLADNVLFGRQVADLSELNALVSRLGLEAFMGRFREGWGTLVGEGGRRLSTGERQVIGLLRALLHPPDLLVVDEGIGSTDEGHAGVILDAIHTFSRERMALVISHDPRVIERADRLYRFHAGILELVAPERDPLAAAQAAIHLHRPEARKRHVHL